MRYAKNGGGSALARVAMALLATGATALVVLSVRGEAQACGGLFCNARPPDPFAPLPVAQNGENVVFFMTKDPAGGAPTLEAHIQILYTGAADKFSWVVPVDAAPTLSTGTDRLFTQLASATQPRFVSRSETEGTCIALPPGPGTGSGGGAGAFAAGTGSAGTTGSAGGGGVTVSFQGAVGPFDAAVIKSDDATALKMWLTTNSYFISDAAGALIDTYVREQKHFVALKLLNGVGVRSIQPIVLTFRGPEPCVPLRLTAIAANPDMPVLVWVFSDKRAVPRGFFELKIDEARIDWSRGGSNYFGPSGLVSQAANEAGGNAFVAEYAGPSAIARNLVYSNGTINLTQLRAAMTPPTYVQQLINMGLASDSLMLPLLARYIPMPEAVRSMGITESAFYGNLSLYWNAFAFPAYDLNALTTAIETSIIEPRLRAQMMIDRQPYLTRLNTYLSPDEMNQDPFFFESKDLPDVPTLHQATFRTMCGNQEYLSCNAPIRLELADGRMIWVRAGSKATTCQGKTVDIAPLQTLPAAELAWEREEVGEGTRVVDNTAMIAAGISANNAKYTAEQTRFPIPTGAGGSAGTGGAGSGTGGTGDLGGTGGGPAGSGGGLAGVAGMGGSTTPPGQTDVGGCGCHIADDATGAGAGAPLGLGLLALVLISRRRRTN